jgi:hypothetical protein
METLLLKTTCISIIEIFIFRKILFWSIERFVGAGQDGWTELKLGPESRVPARTKMLYHVFCPKKYDIFGQKRVN